MKKLISLMSVLLLDCWNIQTLIGAENKNQPLSMQDAFEKLIMQDIQSGDEEFNNFKKEALLKLVPEKNRSENYITLAASIDNITNGIAQNIAIKKETFQKNKKILQKNLISTSNLLPHEMVMHYDQGTEEIKSFNTELQEIRMVETQIKKLNILKFQLASKAIHISSNIALLSESIEKINTLQKTPQTQSNNGITESQKRIKQKATGHGKAYLATLAHYKNASQEAQKKNIVQLHECPEKSSAKKNKPVRKVKSSDTH